MNLLHFSVLLLSLSVYAACNEENFKTDDTIVTFNNTSNDLIDVTKLLKSFNILQKFEICSLSCKGKHCKCCQDILILFKKIPVCITTNFNALGGIFEIGLQVGSRIIASTTTSFGSTFHSCKLYQSSMGDLQICLNVALNDDNNDPNAFTTHVKAEVIYNKIKALRVDFNSVNFNGNIKVEGEIIDGAKALGKIVMLNPLALTHELLKVHRQRNKFAEIELCSNKDEDFENKNRFCRDVGEHAYKGKLVDGVPKPYAYFFNDAELFEELKIGKIDDYKKEPYEMLTKRDNEV